MNQRKLFLAPILVALAALFLFGGPAKADTGQGYLGVYPQTIDEDLKEAFNLTTDHGVIIKGVETGSPADKSGIRQGDILLEYKGEKLTSADDLVRLVRNDKPGQKVDLLVLHKGNEKKVMLELGQAGTAADLDINSFFGPGGKISPGVHSFSKTWQSDNTFIADTYIGVELASLSVQLGEYFGVDDGEGALVTTVMEDSPAAQSGLKAGDVIVEIDGNRVGGPSDVQKAVRKADKGDQLAVTIMRDKTRRTMTIEVAENESMSFFGTDPFNWDDDNFMFFAPKMKDLFRSDFDNDRPDINEELRKEMESLKKELKELKEKVNK
jgi:serine protease Do